MAELSVQDVESFTGGRLVFSAPQTVRLLNEGLAAARRYCGWHVAPLKVADVVTLDGPGSPLLMLPTLRLTELTEVTEDGLEIDIDDLNFSARGMVRKKSTAWWSADYGSIEVTMSHGFADAPDWQGAVLSFIDRVSLSSTTGAEVVGPFQFPSSSSSSGSMFTDYERSILDLYRLERM